MFWQEQQRLNTLHVWLKRAELDPFQAKCTDLDPTKVKCVVRGQD